MSLNISVARSPLTSLREHMSTNQDGQSARPNEPVDVQLCRRFVYAAIPLLVLRLRPTDLNYRGIVFGGTD